MKDEFHITQNDNRIKIFRLPEAYPSDFCFGGGHPVTFQLVDWFDPLDHQRLYNDTVVILSGEALQEQRERVDKFIRCKNYYDPNFQYLAITSYGDTQLIQGEKLEWKNQGK